MSTGLRWVVLLCVLVVVPVASGCSPSKQVPVLEVAPGAARMDEPVSFRVSRSNPGSPVEVTLRSVDAEGTVWSSAATFKADDQGVVDPATMAPQAGYVGAWPMGLFSALQPEAAGSNGYQWPDQGTAVFEFAGRAGDQSLTPAPVTRTFWPKSPDIRTFDVAADGFTGTYYRPANVPRGPAVLVLGGSEGGNPSSSAAVLAARGIPALSVAYFKAAGLPKQLANIPLEYFDRPLDWLRDQPEVDPDRLWISGVSRGSEAAALVAAGRSDVVRGLIALAPSSVANCAFIPDSNQQCPNKPAWLRGGKPVPYTSQWDNPAPDDVPNAVIPVEKINGPVLTVCGGFDQLWNACRYSAAIVRRLEANKAPFPRLSLSYPDAGHAVGFTTPYVLVALSNELLNGAAPLADEQARVDAWPKLIEFISNPK